MNNRNPFHGTRKAAKPSARAETVHDRIRQLAVDDLLPSPENVEIYGEVRSDDREVVKLAKSIRREGILVPLVVTADGFIVSGHRRQVAAVLAGLATVPCQVLAISRRDDHQEFLKLLVEHNRQRVKRADQVLKEALVLADPKDAHRRLTDLQKERQRELEAVPHLELGERRRRAAISAAKRPMLAAVLAVLRALEDFWPLSDRQVHYKLLNDPPLKHSSKPDSIYGNDIPSYRDLTDLLTRGRLSGDVPMEAIADETRPVSIGDIWPDVGGFIARDLKWFLMGYRRDRMQSQSVHIELVGEKLTVQNILKPVAERFCIPMTISRGFCSLPPRAQIAARFLRSGKDRLVLLVASDLDPEGESIAESLPRSLRDDFGIGDYCEPITAIKVALTPEQVERFGLPPMMQAKKSSSRYKAFSAKHGDNVFELEALDPADLQKLLVEAITSVIDVDLFNAEVDREQQDAAKLEAYNGLVRDTLGKVLP